MSNQPTADNPPTGTSVLSDFDRHRRELLHSEEANEGWQAELRRYLKDLPSDVTKDTDIVEWWQVCTDLLLRASY